jgi:16S rRNA C967 or C1407 C5-methylase (RsmB/RsmF family)
VCTWTADETVGVVESFLATHEGFTAEPVAVVSDRGDGARPGLQLTPADHGCDGMYIAVLRRAI